MCELLGMSSNHRTTINLSLTKLSERGEAPNMHGDGWGVAFYEGPDVRLIKDAGEAKDSQWVSFITAQEIHSQEVIAHIRKSTIGSASYSNTHPFAREVFGRMHTFAHNGTLRGIFDQVRYPTVNYHPVGTTDSERAFCLLLDRLRPLWSQREFPSLEARMDVIREFAQEMRKLGPFNFLYSDGDALFAHGHRRHDPMTDTVSWPGLHFLHKHCEKFWDENGDIPKGGIAFKDEEKDFITLFASVPLNKEEWKPLAEGQLMAVRKGEISIIQ